LCDAQNQLNFPALQDGTQRLTQSTAEEQNFYNAGIWEDG